jgi:hypothetical protein
MGAALFVSLERDIPGIDASSVSGKALSRNLDWLNEACQKLNVRPVGELISVNPEEAAAFLEEEGGGVDGFRLPAEQWFEAEEGLRTIEALLQHSESQKPAERNLLEDLKSCKGVLERARHENVRFHFSVDF